MCHNNHQYKVCENILVKRRKNSKHEVEFIGPFLIMKINDDVTVLFQKGVINDATNICRIKPFFDLNISTSQNILYYLFPHPNHRGDCNIPCSLEPT